MSEEIKKSLDYLSFLESMDKVNNAIHKASNIDHMMRDVLDVVLSIFNPYFSPTNEKGRLCM